MRIVALLIFFTLTLSMQAQIRPDTTLLPSLLKIPANKEVQVLYTQIDRDKNNVPSFRHFGYHLDPERYFYPASTVKLPAVIFALEKLNALAIPGLTRSSTMLTDSAFSRQTRVSVDPSAENGLPSIEHYIKKILLTSDNDAFNRLFEFIGRAEFNRKLSANGLNNSRVLNRLAIGDGGEPARHSNPIRFFNGNTLVYSQEAQYDAKDYPLPLANLIRGQGYLDANEKLVMEPYSFADKNAYPLADQQLILRKLLFPEAFPAKERFRLTGPDYELIYTYMSMYPGESTFPKYDPAEFWPAYAKMIFFGRDKQADTAQPIRIFNKYGDSYGYVIDNAYFVDFRNNIEFLVSVVVQSNDDGIYNDGKYEYETVCYPFLRDLGQALYRHELQRKRTRVPDLSKFRLGRSF